MPTLFAHQQKAREKYRHESRIPLFFDAGTGKLFPKGTPVLTPIGYKAIENIQVGDEIIGADGNVHHVVNKYYQEHAEIYKLSFTGGTSIECCADHLWFIRDRDNIGYVYHKELNRYSSIQWEQVNGKWYRVVPTKYLFDKSLNRKYGRSGYRWLIPMCNPVKFTKQPVPVKPYTLGVLIGDGHIENSNHSVTITTMDEEILEGIRRDGYELSSPRGNPVNKAKSYTIYGLYKYLPEEVKNLSYDKHIPASYIYNDVETRIQLLQGLMDTDGSADIHITRREHTAIALRYCTTSPELVRDIEQIVVSLGGTCSALDARKGKYNNIEYATRYCFTLNLPDFVGQQIFTVKRKKVRVENHHWQTPPHRAITDIEYVGDKEGYCLTTDNPDHSYLVKDCLVTHNTLTSLTIARDKYDAGEIDALLVIAPNGVHKQWALEEIPKWYKDVDTTVQWRKNKKLFFVEGKLNIVCTNIEQFSTKTKYLDYVNWVNAHKTMIILDEATRIKNPKAVRTQRLLYEFNDVIKRGKTIITSTPRTVARAILTGTPVTNGPFDVWSMFEFLEPGYFDMNWFAFQNHYGMFHSIDVAGRKIRILINQEAWNGIKACSTFEQANTNFGVTLSTYDLIKQQSEYEGPFRNVEQLRQKMAEIAMFVRIEDCIDMPERTYVRRLLDMSPEQERVYKDMEKYFISMYKGETVEATTKLTSYIRLQQIASGFISSEQLPQDEQEDPPPNKITWFDDLPKFDRLLEDVEEIVGGQEGRGQVIVVCHFSAEAERLYDKLTAEKYNCCLMTGWKKVGSIEGFKQNKYQVMVANIRVIAMGFNLQEHCHHMIFYSNTFSLEDRIQVEARIYRTGQRETCAYIDYVMKDTIDMKVYAALKQKKQLSDYIRDNSVEDMLTKVDDVFKEEYEIKDVDGEVVIF